METRLIRILVAIVGLLPVVAWVLHGLGAGHVASPLDAWFAFQCHRESERTLLLGATLFPVCIRCSGVYLGLLAAAVVPPARLAALSSRAALYAALLGMAGTWALERFALVQVPAGARFAAGLLFGFALARRALTLVSELAASRQVR